MMRITRWRIERFGHFAGVEHELGPGLNVLQGPNEAGKSTLLEFLTWTLFGPERGQRGSGAAGWVTLETEEGEWKVELSRDEVHVRGPHPNVTLEDLVGPVDRKLFRRVFALDLATLAGLKELEHDALKQKLFAASVTGEGPSVFQARRALGAVLEKLWRPRASSLVGDLECDLEEAQRGLRDAQDRARRLPEREAKRRELSAKRSEIEASQPGLAGKIARLEALIAAQPDWRGLQAAENLLAPAANELDEPAWRSLARLADACRAAEERLAEAEGAPDDPEAAAGEARAEAERLRARIGGVPLALGPGEADTWRAHADDAVREREQTEQERERKDRALAEALEEMDRAKAALDSLPNAPPRLDLRGRIAELAAKLEQDRAAADEADGLEQQADQVRSRVARRLAELGRRELPARIPTRSERAELADLCRTARELSDETSPTAEAPDDGAIAAQREHLVRLAEVGALLGDSAPEPLPRWLAVLGAALALAGLALAGWGLFAGSLVFTAVGLGSLGASVAVGSVAIWRPAVRGGPSARVVRDLAELGLPPSAGYAKIAAQQEAGRQRLDEMLRLRHEGDERERRCAAGACAAADLARWMGEHGLLELAPSVAEGWVAELVEAADEHAQLESLEARRDRVKDRREAFAEEAGDLARALAQDPARALKDVIFEGQRELAQEDELQRKRIQRETRVDEATGRLEAARAYHRLAADAARTAADRAAAVERGLREQGVPVPLERAGAWIEGTREHLRAEDRALEKEQAAQAFRDRISRLAEIRREQQERCDLAEARSRDAKRGSGSQVVVDHPGLDLLLDVMCQGQHAGDSGRVGTAPNRRLDLRGAPGRGLWGGRELAGDGRHGLVIALGALSRNWICTSPVLLATM